MKQVLLLRHAKSSWNDATLSDFDRPLNNRGTRAAARMGRYMSDRDLIPDHIICSPAARTRETLDLVLEEWRAQGHAKPKTHFDPEFYGGTATDYLAGIRSAPASSDSVLLLGHNPSIEQLALALCGSADATAQSKVEHKYPTGALAVFTSECNTWQGISSGSGFLESFTLPRELT